MKYRLVHKNEDGTVCNFGGEFTKTKATEQIKALYEKLAELDFTLVVSKLTIRHNTNGTEYFMEGFEPVVETESTNE